MRTPQTPLRSCGARTVAAGEAGLDPAGAPPASTSPSGLDAGGAPFKRPPECPPEVWDRAITRALQRLGDPTVVLPPVPPEELLWQGWADGAVRDERMPADRIAAMTTLHRPYATDTAGGSIHPDSSAA